MEFGTELVQNVSVVVIPSTYTSSELSHAPFEQNLTITVGASLHFLFQHFLQTKRPPKARFLKRDHFTS